MLDKKHTSLRINFNTRNKLREIKYKEGHENMNEVIDHLLELKKDMMK